MGSESRGEAHRRLRSKSYRILEKARAEAARKNGYNSQTTRTELQRLFRERFGKDPYDWQLDVTEAILLGLDSVVIAGTGAGKTMPFMMPLLLNKSKKVIIVSPLKILQVDQAERFEKMQIKTAAVNGDTWDSKLHQDLLNDIFQGILTSPEMCLEHDAFRKILTDENFSKNICAVIVDEAHCISQWGGDFRKLYALLEKLRAFFPPNVPFLATSATLPPLALRDVRSKLAIDPDTSFYLNLGNDRPNVAMSVQKINGSDDYEALRPLLASNVTKAEDMTKTIVFTNTVNGTQTTCKRVRQFFPKPLRKYVDFLHAHRTPRAKRRIMRRFRQGKVKILIATEAAGMGADIPDIMQVIQFGVPSSLSVWIQRAGRAGRSPDINARAILLTEKSMFQWRKKRCRKNVADDVDSESDDSQSDEDSEEEVGGDSDKMEWGKKVEPELRRWIETEDCRRDVADEYFDNPPLRQAPTHICCDNCTRMELDADNSENRPRTPDQLSESGSAHTTPSKTTNTNGKRPMERSKDGPATRRGEHLQNVRHALERWRFKTKRDRYSPSSVTAVTILPDPTLTTLASNARIRTVEDMSNCINPPWIMARRHGDEILEIIKRLDDAEKSAREQVKEAKAAARRRDTEARKAAQKEQKDRQREAKRLQKESMQAERAREKAEEQAEKRRQREMARADKQRQIDTAKSAKVPRRPVLVGSGVFNATSSSPFTMPQIPNYIHSPSTPATPTTSSTFPDVSHPIFSTPSLSSPIVWVPPYSSRHSMFALTPTQPHSPPTMFTPNTATASIPPNPLIQVRPRPRPYIRQPTPSTDLPKPPTLIDDELQPISPPNGCG